MVAVIASAVLGPRIPLKELRRSKFRYLLPTVLPLVSAVLLIISYFQPYWSMTLYAPQYPKGLKVTAYLDHLTGDVRELDGLNHYIGMAPLEAGGKLERSTAGGMIIALSLLLIAAIRVRSRWAALLVIPALLFPLFFLVDLQLWLYYFGHNLDKHAALSSAIKPFTPRVLGAGKVGQFKTIAVEGPGLILAAWSSIVLLPALWFHRRAYKPLVDARKAQQADRAEA